MADLKPPLKPFKRHIFVCTGSRCAPELSGEVYRYLKERIKDLGFHEGPNRIQRSQCHCFGICQQGPLAVVYPDNIWYSKVSKEKAEEILKQHLIGGQPVKAYAFEPDSVC